MVLMPNREPDFTYISRHQFWLEPEMVRYDKDKDELIQMKYIDGKLADSDSNHWGYRHEVQQIQKKFKLNKEVERILLGEEDDKVTE